MNVLTYFYAATLVNTSLCGSACQRGEALSSLFGFTLYLVNCSNPPRRSEKKYVIVLEVR